MPLRIGDYRHRVRLERPTAKTGYVTVEDRVSALIAFSVAELPERRESGRAQTAFGPYTIRMRYRTDIKAEWRVVDCETWQTFQILSWGDRTGRREEVWLVATEVQ